MNIRNFYQWNRGSSLKVRKKFIFFATKCLQMHFEFRKYFRKYLQFSSLYIILRPVSFRKYNIQNTSLYSKWLDRNCGIESYVSALWNKNLENFQIRSKTIEFRSSFQRQSIESI